MKIKYTDWFVGNSLEMSRTEDSSVTEFSQMLEFQSHKFTFPSTRNPATTFHTGARGCSPFIVCPVTCTSLHCTALHCTALHCTSRHCTALHCTLLHCTALHFTSLHFTAKQYTTQHSNILICHGPLWFPYDKVECKLNENNYLGFPLKNGLIKEDSKYFCELSF